MTAITVTLANPTTLDEHHVDVVTVDKHTDLVSASIEAVQLASKQLAAKSMDYDVVVKALGDSGYLDLIDRIAEGFLVHHVSKTVLAGSAAVRYLVDANYSDYPEGGAWSDWVGAVDSDDAELQAKFIMAVNENAGDHASGVPFVKDYATFASRMDDENINGLEIDPVTKMEAFDLLRRLAAAGANMVSAFGNCGSPHQQEVATALLALVKETNEAMSMIDNPGQAPARPGDQTAPLVM
jgi:hypothetical protein